MDTKSQKLFSYRCFYGPVPDDLNFYKYHLSSVVKQEKSVFAPFSGALDVSDLLRA